MLGKIFRYVIDHDMGFSPNPFYGVCTLANCKPEIRRMARIGDFVLGFGSAKSSIRYRLIYWMKIEEIISFDEFWKDPRFEIKKPVVNGGHMKFHGDNIYRVGEGGVVVQEPSFHSLPSGEPNPLNVKTDTGRTNRVLIGKTFGYYGRSALVMPDCLSAIIPIGRGHRVKVHDDVRFKTIQWLLSETGRGFIGEPSGWARIGK